MLCWRSHSLIMHYERIIEEQFQTRIPIATRILLLYVSLGNFQSWLRFCCYNLFCVHILCIFMLAWHFTMCYVCMYKSTLGLQINCAGCPNACWHSDTPARAPQADGLMNQAYSRLSTTHGTSYHRLQVVGVYVLLDPSCTSPTCGQSL